MGIAMKPQGSARLPGLLLVLLLACSGLHASDSGLTFAQESSIPPAVTQAFRHSRAAEKYVFAAHHNPFYLQGDFNGDGRLDCAILVIRVLGAGHHLGNGGDDFSWMDAWYAYSKGEVYRGAGGSTPPILKGDALMVIKTEAASAVIYWTGTEYRWYQQGD